MVVERLGDPPNRSLLDHIASAEDAARVAGIRVVYVTIGCRVGHPEVSPRNPMFARLARQAEARLTADEWASGLPAR